MISGLTKQLLIDFFDAITFASLDGYFKQGYTWILKVAFVDTHACVCVHPQNINNYLYMK